MTQDGEIVCQQEVMALLHQLERPPGEPIPPGTSAAELIALEKRTGIPIPRLLRQWLMVTNGPCVGQGGITGINTKRDLQDIESVLRRRPHWKDKGWIPVAGDGFGDYYVVATRNEFGPGEPVLFVDVHEEEGLRPSYIVASNIWRFMRFLFLRELKRSKWPFEKAEVVASDSDIIQFSGVPLPWDI